MSQLSLTHLHETARDETVLAEATVVTSHSSRATIGSEATASATARNLIQAERDRGIGHDRAGSGTRDVGRVVMAVDQIAVVPEASITPRVARLDRQVGSRAPDQEQR